MYQCVLTLFQPFSVVTKRFLSQKWCPNLGLYHRTEISCQSCSSGLKDQRKEKNQKKTSAKDESAVFFPRLRKWWEQRSKCVSVGFWFLFFPLFFHLELAESLMVIAPVEWKCKIWTEDLWWQKVFRAGSEGGEEDSSARSSLMLWICSQAPCQA